MYDYLPKTGSSPLSVQNLTTSKEKTYFNVVVILACLVWMLIAFTIVGLFYAGLFGFMLWLGNGMLIAHLRAECVRVNETQLPQLHATFLDICSKLGLSNPPQLYVLQSGGALNAFATRFSGRNFVVIFSDMLDTFGPESKEIQFILGHEIGHLKSNHIVKRMFLAPGLIVPLIGQAYLRACEASCDRYGAFAVGDIEASTRALLALGGGKVHGPTLDARTFANQHHLDRGFFVSLHELTSGYPTLSQRVANLLALEDSRFDVPAKRNAMAYIAALFIPAGGRTSGGPANALIVIVIIGLLAAMAIPAFQKVRQTAQLKTCLNYERMISSALQQYELDHGRPPTNIADFVGPGKSLQEMPACPNGGDYSIIPDGQGGGTITCPTHGEYSY